MNLIWISDPHLDRAGPAAVERFLGALRARAAEAVILTGDLSNSSRIIDDLELLSAAAGAPIYHVLGNHDHYGSSVGKVRDAIIGLAERSPSIQWLPPAGVIRFSDGTALVGVDGWADGRFGDPLHTPLTLNDDRMIEEVAAQADRTGKLFVKRALADADARRLETLLERAVADGSPRIIVATHVPPFVEALAPRSRESHPHWHPLLVCGATGGVLRDFAARHPDLPVTVLAGHSHREHEATIQPNLEVRVAGARYGAPMINSVA